MGFDEGGGEVCGEDGLVVELGDDGFSAEADGVEEGSEGGFLGEGVGFTVELDVHV